MKRKTLVLILGVASLLTVLVVGVLAPMVGIEVCPVFKYAAMVMSMALMWWIVGVAAFEPDEGD